MHGDVASYDPDPALSPDVFAAKTVDAVLSRI